MMMLPIVQAGQEVGSYYLSVLQPGVLELVSISINTAKRNRGYAHLALNDITAEADRVGNTLVLQVMPDPSSHGAPADALHRLYCKHGFVGTGTYLRRAPRQNNAESR